MEDTAEVELKDETKKGHALGAVTPNFVKATAERGLNGLQVALTRFIMHASLALGMFLNRKQLSNDVTFLNTLNLCLHFPFPRMSF